MKDKIQFRGRFKRINVVEKRYILYSYQMLSELSVHQRGFILLNDYKIVFSTNFLYIYWRTGFTMPTNMSTMNFSNIDKGRFLERGRERVGRIGFLFKLRTGCFPRTPSPFPCRICLVRQLWRRLL